MIKLTEAEQFIYDWQYGRLSKFKETLATLMHTADANNTVKLGKGYPDEMNAILRFRNETLYWDDINKRGNS